MFITVIIKIDLSNAFNTTCRALTLDALSGYASRNHVCGLKYKEGIESTCEPLSNMLAYFHVMRTCHATLLLTGTLFLTGTDRFTS